MDPIEREVLDSEFTIEQLEADVLAKAQSVDDKIDFEIGAINVQEELDNRPPPVVPEQSRSALGYADDIAAGIIKGPLKLVDEVSQAFGDLAGFFGATDVERIAKSVNITDAASSIGLADPQTAPGQMTAGVSQFLAGFVPVAKGAQAITGVKNITSMSLTQLASAGALVDAIGFDPNDERLSDLVESVPALSNPITAYLAADPEDSAAEGRLKNALEGLGIGGAIDGVFVAVRAIRAGRNAKSTLEAADSLVESNKRVMKEPAIEPAKETPEVSPKANTRESDVFGEKLQVREAAVDLGTLKLQENPVTGTTQGVDETKVKAIQEAIRNGEEIPEILVRQDGDGTFTVVDGHHRLEAMKREGMDTGDVFRIADKDEFEAAGKPPVDPNSVAQPKSFFSKDDFRARMQLDPQLRNKLAARIEAGDLNGAEDLIDFNSNTVDWDVIDDPDQVSQLINTTSEVLSDFMDDAKGGVQTLAQTKRLANLVGGTAEGVSKLFADVRGGGGITARLYSAQKVLTSSAERLQQLAKKAAETGQQVDELAFYRHVEMHGLVQAQVKGAGTEVARALHAMRDMKAAAGKDFTEFDTILNQAGGKNAEMRKRMLNHVAKLRDEGQINKIVRKSRWRRGADMALEVYINGLLSSFSTLTLNNVSNTLKVMEGVIENYVAAGIGKVRGNADRITLAEANARMFGTVAGLRNATGIEMSKLAKLDFSGVLDSPTAKAFKEEKPQLDVRQRVDADTRKAIASTGTDANARAINVLGKIIRLPGRLILTSDEFFKQIAYTQELHAIAFRQATKIADDAGVIGAKRAKLMEREIALVIKDPPESLHFEAIDYARYQTFQADLESQLGRDIENVLNRNPQLKFIIPFYRTPVNIVKQTILERTPIPLIVGSHSKMWRTIAAGGPEADIQLARLAAGGVAMGTAATWAMDGSITGSGLNSGPNRNSEALDGIPPYSIKIWGVWFQYNRLEPMGMLMGLAADLVELRTQWGETEETEVAEAAAMILTVLTTNITDKTWFKGFADLTQMIQDPKRYAPSYMTNLTTTMVTPYSSLLRRTSADFDETARQAFTWMDTLKAKLPGLSKTLPPRRDMLGNPIIRTDYLGPAMLSPIAVGRETTDPVYKELARLEFSYQNPNKDLFITGEDVSAEIYSEFMNIRGNTKFGGQTLQEALGRLIESPAYKNVLSDLAREEKIKSILGKYTIAARGKMLKDDPELLQRFKEQRILDNRSLLQ